jgi:hypothetical protein
LKILNALIIICFSFVIWLTQGKGLSLPEISVLTMLLEKAELLKIHPSKKGFFINKLKKIRR